MSERTTIGGVTYESIGSSTSNLLLKCNGTARIQWGSKLIDLVKNGKIALGNSSNNIYIISDISEITSDGIYVINNEQSSQVLINKQGKQYPITSDLYISANKTQDLTVEQKQQAMQNLGIYYPSLQDLQISGITNGIGYTMNDNKLYNIQNGVISEVMLNTVTVGKTQSNGENTNLDVVNADFADNDVYTNPGFVRGMIIMHYGNVPIPDGWAICDGKTYTYNGTSISTPNLVGRFIKAAENSSQVGSIDGELNTRVLLATDNTEVQPTIPIQSEPNSYALVFIMKL